MTPFTKSLSIVGGPSAMARILNVTPQAVCFWRDGKRELPVECCPAIELATSGEVTRRDLRPDDWWLIWPELVTEEFPAPERTTREAA